MKAIILTLLILWTCYGPVVMVRLPTPPSRFIRYSQIILAGPLTWFVGVFVLTCMWMNKERISEDPEENRKLGWF